MTTHDSATGDAPRDGTNAQAGGTGRRADLSDQLAQWAVRAIASYPRPRVPIDEPWEASIAGLVRQAPFVPRIATKPLELLDRLGAVHVSPERVGFDGTEVEWDRVVELHLEPVSACLTAEAIEAQAEKFAQNLPPIPGRMRAARLCASLTMSLYMAIVPPDDDGVVQLPGPIEDRLDTEALVITQVVRTRRGLGASGIEASTAAALLQWCFPESAGAMVAAARARGLPVIELAAERGAVGREVTRAASWRLTAGKVRQRLAKVKGDRLIGDGADRSDGPDVDGESEPIRPERPIDGPQ